MPEFKLRKLVLLLEETTHDFGPRLADPRRRAACAAIVANPFAGGYHAHIQPAMQDLKPLGLMMSNRLVALLGRDGIDGYGKGAIVGEAGEIEHGALWHVPGGYAMREVLGHTKAIVPSSKKVGGLGATLDVPLAPRRRRLRPQPLRRHRGPRRRRPPRRRDRLRPGDERRPAPARPHGRPRRRRHQGPRRPAVTRRLAALAALAPTRALAHASERMVILTLPTGRYMLGAALAVALTAAAAIAAPRLPRLRPIPLFRLPDPPALLSWLSAALVLALVALGFLGPRDPLGNLLPLTAWTLVAVALPWRPCSSATSGRRSTPGPARRRCSAAACDLTGGLGLARLGHLPAVAGLLGLAWFEIVALAPETRPSSPASSSAIGCSTSRSPPSKARPGSPAARR